MEGAIALIDRYDAEFLDALIFSWNERQVPPEKRVEDYLKRCVDQMYENDPAQQLKDLGYEEGMTVIRAGPHPPPP